MHCTYIACCKEYTVHNLHKAQGLAHLEVAVGEAQRRAVLEVSYLDRRNGYRRVPRCCHLCTQPLQGTYLPFPPQPPSIAYFSQLSSKSECQLSVSASIGFKDLKRYALK